MTRLRVETLGPLRVRLGDRELAIGPPKQRALFAVLALHAGHLVSRDDLIEHLWGPSAPATAVGSLHTYASGLRRALNGTGAVLACSGCGYLLRLDGADVDLRAAERFAADARALARRDPDAAVTALDAALARWQPGSVLGGIPGPYADTHRTSVADLRLRLQLERAELLLGLARPAGLAEQLRGLAVAYPYHEKLRALLITALHRDGRTADALAQYQDLREVLARDLGLDPSAELRALHTAVLTDDAGVRTAPAALPVPAPVQPAQLPRGTGAFVGRAEEVRRVLDDARSTSDGSRVTMIVGVGGVGKTELAVRAGHLLAAEFPDGQLYVNLRGFDPKHPPRPVEDALRHLLTSLNIGTVPAEREQRAALWRSTLRDRRVLILLDNAASAEQVEDLLPGDGPSHVLVTSRVRLSGLAVRYAARRVTLGPLSPRESVELLADAIGDDGTDPATARRIADLCDRLPLALRIASEQVAAGTRVAALAEDLANARRRLDALQIPDDKPHSVRAVLSVSYAALDPTAARAFRALGTFPGADIHADAAAALLGVPARAASEALGGLAAQHLVDAADGRYAMHDLTHLYASEKSREGETTAERHSALDRVIAWYAGALAPGLATAERIAWCAREWDNIDALLRTARRIGRHEPAWRLAQLLGDYFQAAGPAREWVETLRLGLYSADLLDDPSARMLLLGQLGRAHIRLGRYDDALRELQAALRLFNGHARAGDTGTRASIIADKAGAFARSGDLAGALLCAVRATTLARATGSARHEAHCLTVLADVYARLGDFPAAVRYSGRAVEAAGPSGDAFVLAAALVGSGNAAHGLGATGRARGHYREALALCESSGDRYHDGLALFGLARTHRAGPERHQARRLATRALERLTELAPDAVSAVTGFLRSQPGDRPPERTRLRRVRRPLPAGDAARSAPPPPGCLPAAF